MVSLLIFLFVLFWLVVMHEAGHFFAAQLLGIRVEEFAIGFGPKLWSTVRRNVRYSINILPLGGFVRIFGEDGTEEQASDGFTAKPFRIKLIVLAAGVAMNWLVAVGLFSLVLLLGRPLPVNDSANVPGAFVQITLVAPQSPAQEANIQVYDKIIRLTAQQDTISPIKISEVLTFIKDHSGTNVVITLERHNTVLNVTVVPRIAPPSGQGPLGVALARGAVRAFPWYEAPWRGGFLAASNTVVILKGFGGLFHDLFAGKNVIDQVAGPVGLLILTSDVTGFGLTSLLYFVGLISISLALVNFIPIPGLDGGRAFFIIIEQIMGRPIPKKIAEPLNAAGFMAIFFLLIVITGHELQKYHAQLLKLFFGS